MLDSDFNPEMIAPYLAAIHRQPQAKRHKPYDQPELSGAPWVLSTYSANGALRTIETLIKLGIDYYYPYIVNDKQKTVPMWANYLFTQLPEDEEHRALSFSFGILSDNPKFIKIITNNGKPSLIRNPSIIQHWLEVAKGKFNYQPIIRPYYAKGAIVEIKSGRMAGKSVTLLEAITPEEPESRIVRADCGHAIVKVRVRELLYFDDPDTGAVGLARPS